MSDDELRGTEPRPDDLPGGATEVKQAGSSNASSGRSDVRFTPGSMLAERYRIVALLGKGGMGEVYRADDVKLGQQVALKFLPRRFAADREKLQRLFDEVRLGRTVSHPNVCRMYDVAEWEGHHFIAMEYIDGEDLASLLRRIGKLPHEKALDLARDLCAGLAAAHGMGIIHRDLKPANVMIDGRGNARITDFGLAALVEDLEQRREIAGTPAYMAPEQLAGGQVTQKTDLYSLGLILYEMFTGKRMFDGTTLGEIVSQHKTSSSQSLPSQTAELDPAVQRVIVRCLEQDSSRRPGSIHAVIAALPGGDPLQAAIDAGETPSPEMLAAAGETGELKPAIAWPLLLITILLILGAGALSQRVRLYGRTSLPLEVSDLTFKARQIIVMAGGPERAVDSVRHFGVDGDFRSASRRANRKGEEQQPAAAGRFSTIYFAYRESPVALVDQGNSRVMAMSNVPPFDVPGMAQVFLEPDGRLRKLILVPGELADRPGGIPDFAPLLKAAGLDPKNAREVAPEWRPPIGSDRRFAWDVTLPGSKMPVRVEAASFAGRISWFEVISPWKVPAQGAADVAPPGQSRSDLILLGVLIASFVVGWYLASRNVRRGRYDRKGAVRVAVFCGGLSMLFDLLTADHHLDGSETGVVLEMLAWACFLGMSCWIWYTALEPYLRRRWPRTLIAWSRLLQGRWSDSLVARHVLIGVLAGSGVAFLRLLGWAIPEWLGWPAPTPPDGSFLELSSLKYSIALTIQAVPDGVITALAWTFVLLVAHLAVRNRQMAIAVVFVLVVLVARYENYAVFEWSVKLVYSAVVLWVMTRYGLVAFATALAARNLYMQTAPTFDTSVFYFARGLVPMALLIGIAVFAFVRTLKTGPLFTEAVLED